MKIIKFSLFLIGATLLIFSIAMPSNAGLIKEEKKNEFMTKLNQSSGEASAAGEGYSSDDLETIIGRVIRVALSLLGVIFIIYMFLTGNDWMQAAGNEEKVNLAKSRLQSLLVGLIIVLVAFALSYGFSRVLSSFLIQ